MIKEKLERIDSLFKEKRPEYYSYLQDEVSDDKIVELEKILPGKLPPEFIELYKWKNGQDPRKFHSFYENRMFMPIEEIIEIKELMDGMIGYDFEDPKYWRKGWIPFLSNGGGSHLCLDLVAEDGGTKNQLIGFWKADEDRDAEFSNISEWLDEVIDELVNDLYDED
ncbi:MAG: SMI1/KNR4 family protein [Lentisphaeraceae bacterium]|nr:SMI1/KNR4 family protein [Lentisphaeraceae bacterium]